ncbi:arginase family protein [Neisseria sp. Ec49-e6-T10]|uniref:arginase family protein n=1 Tax=Neisseria sp. Ec49-e6-T10 TaxID=3140744 RepID=UPI003EBB2BFC
MNNLPVILDFDQSVFLPEQTTIIDLHQWQDDIRFGCMLSTFKSFETELNKKINGQIKSPIFIGSGDYHHISTLLIKQLAQQINTPFQVVVFDNHPDNMRFPFGIHCGSWVAHIAKLPYISHIHVVGITSSDIGFTHLWENHLKPLYQGKLTYWCLQTDTTWIKKVGLNAAYRRFNTPDELIAAFNQEQALSSEPTYLSIDKDVLSVDTVQTNWDQGCLLERHLFDTISTLKPRIVGSDITGEVSIWHYKHWWKRFLSQLDAQQEPSQAELKKWQMLQNQLNQRLLSALTK